MNISKKWLNILNWPASSYNQLMPWYIIGYRSLFIPLIYTGLISTFIGLIFSNGLFEAKIWWKNQGITL